MAKSIRMSSLIGLAIALVVYAAACLAQGMLQLGNVSYARAEAPHLRIPVSSSAGFFRGVGGVAFSAVAQGDNGLRVVGLQYDPTAADGERLVIALDSGGVRSQVRGRIYDWQLAPIARFAQDENGSAMTLFGHLQDKALEERLHGEHKHVINYHPSLDNTLVGLRLLQADMLIIDPNAADLFRQGDTVLLGAGEGRHDPVLNRQRFDQVGLWQVTQAKAGNVYRSYVVGDLGQRVSFHAEGQRIAFTGEPFWNCWRAQRTPEQVDALMHDDMAAYGRTVDDYNAQASAARAGFESLTALQQQQTMRRLGQRRQEIDAMEARLVARMESAEGIQQMPEYSVALSQQIRAQHGINPVVYATIRQVMHYRALFKSFRYANPSAYAAFVRSLDGVTVSPSVTTPTHQQ